MPDTKEAPRVEMVLGRYLIVTNDGGDSYYHLVSEQVWRALLQQFERETYYDKASALDVALASLFSPDETRTMLEEDPDPLNAICLFLGVIPLMTFCKTYNITILEESE